MQKRWKQGVDLCNSTMPDQTVPSQTVISNNPKTTASHMSRTPSVQKSTFQTSRLSVCMLLYQSFKQVVKGKHCIMERMASHSISLHWQQHSPGRWGLVLTVESCSLGRTMPERCNDSFDTALQSYTPYTVIPVLRSCKSLRRKVQWFGISAREIVFCLKM